MISFFRKSHKWLGIILACFLLMFAASGIILNHRRFFSGVDLSRKLMPREHRYVNWNNASVKGSLHVDGDSILLYGNVGIWLTGKDFESFRDFNEGFPKGIDSRKISSLYMTPDGELFAGSYFGLYHLEKDKGVWQRVELPIGEDRVVDLAGKGDTLLVLTRSLLLQSTDYERFSVHQLPAPVNYDDRVGLFKTIWVIHSGEIYGQVGKLIVDAVGLILIFLVLTGLIFFVNRHRIRGRKRRGKEVKPQVSARRWSLKWHNKVGWMALVLLLLTTGTGMFLRPPLLIAIVTKKVNKIPHTKLDSPNPWFDKLRALRYDQETGAYILSTSDGFYLADTSLSVELQEAVAQPPVSVMGINVFEEMAPGTWLVGSFSGLYVWIPQKGIVVDRISGKPWQPGGRPAPSTGMNMISGISRDFGSSGALFDYNLGVLTPQDGPAFPEMPEVISRSPVSLWNAALEVHTGRIYKPLLGGFSSLVVPLVGLLTLLMSLAGFIVWFKKYR